MTTRLLCRPYLEFCPLEVYSVAGQVGRDHSNMGIGDVPLDLLDPREGKLERSREQGDDRERILGRYCRLQF